MAEIRLSAERWLLAAFLAATLACTPRVPDTIVEADTPAIGPDGRLKEDIGLETLGGVFTPLLRTGCATPCSIEQTFSTAEDNQTQIRIFLHRGTGALVAKTELLGRFEIQGVPPGRKGEPQVKVTLSVEKGNITLRATDASGKRLVIKRLEA